jgi:hypothetical protein
VLTYLECNNLRIVDATPLGTCPSLFMFNVSYNDDLQIILCPEFDIKRSVIKRNLPIIAEEGFKKWLMWNIDADTMRKFKTEMRNKYSNFTEDLLENMHGITDQFYLKNMDVPADELAQNINKINTIYNEFKNFL